MKGIVGLEIHVYLSTKEKLFCRCRASREKGQMPNSFVCPICTGQPGAKPMLPNSEAVKNAVKVGLMLGCKINEKVFWQRKHYDWPDLPKGYQNTISGAYSVPLGVNGKFEGIKIESMHLEEDPAAWNPRTGEVDYNRSGLPLVEIVTAPDFAFSEEVGEWLKKLVRVLSYLKCVDRDAGIKADVNVNVISGGKRTERVEVKNVNSIDNVMKAIEFEFGRQMKERSVRETRRFDEVKGETFRMRSKEEEDDYRFIADPDLVDLELSKSFIDGLRESLPESPEVKLARVVREYEIGKRDAEVLTKNLDVAEFFEEVVNFVEKRERKKWAKFVLPWVTVELLRVLNWNKKNLDDEDVDIKSEHFVKLVRLVKDGKITGLQAKQILNKFVPKSFDPSDVNGKIDDGKELEKIVRGVVEKNGKVVQEFKLGNKNSFNFLMGEIMKATNRRADFKVAREILERVLSGAS